MNDLAKIIGEYAVPLVGSPTDYDPLLNLIGDAPMVLLGGATHGTHEFYQARALITQRLIEEKGFSAVAVEGDWPDAYRVNRFVQGQSEDEDVGAALGGFKAFPAWLWRNTEVADFVEWLRCYNDTLPKDTNKADFYGLDLFSLHRSIGAVLDYLGKVDPESAERARKRYASFARFGKDTQTYGLPADVGSAESLQAAAITQLLELCVHESAYQDQAGRMSADELFFAEQNARLIKNAEHYYRLMFQEPVSSWNLRASHMMETLRLLENHLRTQQRAPKIVVWAHNAHVGNAAATVMKTKNEFNLGQLARERFGRGAVLVGFTTYRGKVTAAAEWDAPAEQQSVKPAGPGSYEDLFHEVPFSRFMLDLRDPQNAAVHNLSTPRLERAIGVIYQPENERDNHYFEARLPEQFDVVLHFDQTKAVQPLERTGEWQVAEVEETFPTGL